MRNLLLFLAVAFSLISLVLIVLVNIDLLQLNEEAYPLLYRMSKSEPTLDAKYRLNSIVTAVTFAILFISNLILIMQQFFLKREIAKFSVQQMNWQAENNAATATNADEAAQETQVAKKYTDSENNWIAQLNQYANTSNPSMDLAALLTKMCQVTNAVQGKVFEKANDEYVLCGSYAIALEFSMKNSFTIGEGFIGESARTKRTFAINDIPSGYIEVISGLGTAEPNNLVIIPAIRNAEVVAVFEMAFFGNISANMVAFLEAFTTNMVQHQSQQA